MVAMKTKGNKESAVLINLLHSFPVVHRHPLLPRQSVCMKIAHSVSLRMHTLQGQEAAINDQQGSARQQAAQKLTLDEIKALQPGQRRCAHGAGGAVLFFFFYDPDLISSCALSVHVLVF